MTNKTEKPTVELERWMTKNPEKFTIEIEDPELAEWLRHRAWKKRNTVKALFNHMARSFKDDTLKKGTQDA